jgi:hypothetical protein
MSVPRCICKIKYQLSDARPAIVEHCPFHQAAAELFELVDMQIALRGEPILHKDCRCWSCRAIKALAKARRIAGPGVPVAVAASQGK